MEIRTLRYFLTVCREGTMSRAAEVLHVTQPALSRQIAGLERELGAPLLERHSRSVTPTEKGLYLLRRAQEIVGLADATEADFSQQDGIVAGTIRIGAGESEGVRIVARAARAFRAKHPGVRFHLHSASAIDLVERLEHGIDDFAVLMSYPDIDRFAHLRLRPTDAYGVLMREDDPLAAQRTVGPADLGGAALILPERLCRDGAPTGLLGTWFGEHGRDIEVAAMHNLNFNAALFVDEGVGRLISFEGLTPTGPGTGLAFRLLYPPVVSVIDVAWKRDVALPHAAQLFLEQLREEARTRPGGASSREA